MYSIYTLLSWRLAVHRKFREEERTQNYFLFALPLPFAKKKFVYFSFRRKQRSETKFALLLGESGQRKCRAKGRGIIALSNFVNLRETRRLAERGVRLELILENIRSFVGRHEIPIKPLTFLIGENSAGKTTLLAAYNAALFPEGFPGRPPFNQPPYSMGNYRTLATRNDETDKSAEFISLGYDYREAKEDAPISLTARYVDANSNVQIRQITARSHHRIGEILLTPTPDGIYVELKFTQDDSKVQEMGYPLSEKFLMDTMPSGLRGIFTTIFSFLWKDEIRSTVPLVDGIMLLLLQFIKGKETTLPFSIAPMRSPPQRTYNGLDLQNSSTGDGFAFDLIELLKSETQMKRLQTFGKDAGLFDRVGVEAQRLGDNALAEVRITHGGVTANLTDVGYGVSQALPLVVSCLTVPKESPILIQQPEVHLHPRAQAALGTFFVEMVQEEGKQFLIETHSDYILDRVRIEVAQGKIPAEDVLFLFLEKRDNRTTVYPMPLDENGNLLDAPPSYGDFFLQEQMRLLQRA